MHDETLTSSPADRLDERGAGDRSQASLRLPVWAWLCIWLVVWVSRMKQAGFLVKLSGTPGEIKHVDPQPADFTEEILAEAGLDQARIDALRKAGVVD
jgi:hypothetical protein